MKHPPCLLRPAGWCLAALLTTVALAAQTSSPATESATATGDTRAALPHEDRRFVEQAAKAGDEEVALAQIALHRSANANVKKLAQMILDDHQPANDELAALAAARGVELPKGKDEHRWENKDAKEFDRDYVRKMVSDHEDAIKLFSHESKAGHDSALVEFARKILPKLEHHLEQANELKNPVR